MKHDFVPFSKFKEIEEKYGAFDIMKGKKVKVIRYLNDYWVCVGGVSSYDQKRKTGFSQIQQTIVKAVPLKQYDGFFKPLEYHECNLACKRMKRPGGYTGMLVNSDIGQIVLTGETREVRCNYEGDQQELF